MQAKYDELALTDNLSGVILPTDRNKHIYGKVLYDIPPVVALYDDSIETDKYIKEVHQADGNHKVRRNNHALY